MLFLYDTLSRKLKSIKKSSCSPFGFYCCGPTVYENSHIGNFRTFILQDVFRRTVEQTGVETLHVRNITDVDDKTILNSQKANKSLKEFTDFWKKKFSFDCKELNILPPHKEPRAVEHIEDQINLIKELIKKGHAYKGKDGSIYYKINSFTNYGKLSNLDKRDLKQGASKGISEDEYNKDSVSDFALWKANKPEDGENYWESPWGKGRPGWHLECSAMSHKYLGETFDLHSGGVDLIFPHHDNEIAQSEACYNKPMCNHWFHLAHLLIDGGKMSKSIGNVYTLDQIKQFGFSPIELRYALISSHYRKPLNFISKNEEGEYTFPSLLNARNALIKLKNFYDLLKEKSKINDFNYIETKIDQTQEGNIFKESFDALLDDLNVPEALGQVFLKIKKIDVNSIDKNLSKKYFISFNKIMYSLGLNLSYDKKEELIDIPIEIKDKADQRYRFKKEKDWSKADKIRIELLNLGWKIEDTKDNYKIWKM